MWTLSVFASLAKRFQLASSVHAVDKMASSGSHSLPAKSTLSEYSHSSGMPQVEIGGLGLLFSVGHAVNKTASSGFHSSSAKSTSSAYSHSSDSPRVKMYGLGLVVFCLTATRAAAR